MVVDAVVHQHLKHLFYSSVCVFVCVWNVECNAFVRVIVSNRQMFYVIYLSFGHWLSVIGMNSFLIFSFRVYNFPRIIFRFCWAHVPCYVIPKPLPFNIYQNLNGKFIFQIFLLRYFALSLSLFISSFRHLLCFSISKMIAIFHYSISVAWNVWPIQFICWTMNRKNEMDAKTD